MLWGTHHHRYVVTVIQRSRLCVLGASYALAHLVVLCLCCNQQCDWHCSPCLLAKLQLSSPRMMDVGTTQTSVLPARVKV